MSAEEQINFEEYRERIVEAVSTTPLVNEYIEVMFYNLSQLPPTLPIPYTIRPLIDDFIVNVCDYAISQAGKIEIDIHSPTFKRDFANLAATLFAGDFLEDTGPFIEQTNVIKERMMSLSPRADDRMFKPNMSMCIQLIIQSAILAIKGYEPGIIRRTPEEIADAQAQTLEEFGEQVTIANPEDAEISDVAEDVAEILEGDRKNNAN